MAEIAYRTADVDGLTVFYREAGASDAPTLVLLHGFPSASHMFRELIPPLADRFHLVAPDLPGFGNSDMPPRGEFDYTFEHLSDRSARPRPLRALRVRLRRAHRVADRRTAP